MENGAYGFVSFTVGFLAGFQAVYERFRADSLKAGWTPYGVLFLSSRGAMAAIVFETFPAPAFLTDHPLWRALLYGFGVEVILRSKYYLKRFSTGDGNFGELIRGPLDFLRWYQDFFLSSIDNNFARARIRRAALISPRYQNLLQMARVFEQNIGAYHQDRQDVLEAKDAVLNHITKYLKDLQKSGDNIDPGLDKKYRYQLCYIVESFLGRKALQTVFENGLVPAKPHPMEGQDS